MNFVFIKIINVIIVSIVFSSVNFNVSADTIETDTAMYESTSRQTIDKILEKRVKATERADSTTNNEEISVINSNADDEDLATAMSRNLQPSYVYRKQQAERRRVYEKPPKGRPEGAHIYYPYGYPSYGYPNYRPIKRPIKRKPIIKIDEHPHIP